MAKTKGRFGMTVEEINAASKKRGAEIRSQNRTKKRMQKIRKRRMQLNSEAELERLIKGGT